MQHLWPAVARDGPVLVHGDFWAGNTLWQRHRLTGIVDWEMVARASRGYDVGYTHMDLALSVGGVCRMSSLRPMSARLDGRCAIRNSGNYVQSGGHSETGGSGYRAGRFSGHRT